MIENTFHSGNYNQWEHLVNNVLPAKNMILRQEIIPAIDNLLINMLGPGVQVTKELINVEEICDRKSLKGIRFEINYIIQDFIAPEAPKAAIDKDIQAISQALLRNDFNLITVNIDVSKGRLTVVYETAIVGD